MRRPHLLLVLALVAGGCKSPQLGNGCQQDSDCGQPETAFRCELTTGVCYCRTDAACAAGQFCNGLGFCQDRSGCEKNADCIDPGLFCETSSGSCLSRGRCTTDIQCELGSVCDTKRQTCVEGCRDNGDCAGVSCRCGDEACRCTGTTPAERAACTVGVCDPNFCADDSFCRYGEVCAVPPDAGVARATCFNDFDIDQRPYCSRCTGGAGLETCGRGANYCIIDTRTASTYCGADCSEGQACPHGYGCRDIRIVLTRWQCSATLACPGDQTLPCDDDHPCRRGGDCVKAPGQTQGFCAGQCRLREGSSFGYCSCQVDLDCPQQTCSQGECSINRKNCVNDTDCNTIRCVDFDGVGACLIGQNCTPANGLTCNEVQ